MVARVGEEDIGSEITGPECQCYLTGRAENKSLFCLGFLLDLGCGLFCV